MKVFFGRRFSSRLFSRKLVDVLLLAGLLALPSFEHLPVIASQWYLLEVALAG